MATLTDLAVLIKQDVLSRFASIASTFRTAELAVGAAPNPAYLSRLTTTNGDGKVAVRVEQNNTAATVDAVKIVNNAPAYALKIDHSAADKDAVNIAASGGGGYTVLGVGGNNTSLSTVKVTNSAPQVGGAIVYATGTDLGRTAPIFGGDNYGTSGGATFSAHQWEGSNSPAFRAIYDAGYAHSARVLWIDANHNDGNLIYVNNATAQTSGQMVNLIAAAGSTAPIIQIINPGSGDHITANNFKVTQGGNVAASAFYNFSTFNNARLQVTSLGAVIDRNVGDTASALRINQAHASSTGDVAQFQAAGAVKARVMRSGAISTLANTAPTDASLAAGEAAVWFDSTNGAAKLMVKAKQADGTVRTGSVVLA